MSHPAPYSPEVLDKLARLVPVGTRVHDPFAGEGLRLGKRADEIGWTFTGTEIEAPFIEDDRVRVGNALDPATYPTGRYCIVTSPVYPNGIADNFNAQDGSRRRTYRAALAKLTGMDRELHPDNQGRWGYRGTSIASTRRAVYWNLATRAVACWSGADAVFLNVSDFTAKDRTEPVVDGWAGVLRSNGWRIVKAHPVKTRRWRDGANSDKRVDGEVVLHAVRSSRA